MGLSTFPSPSGVSHFSIKFRKGQIDFLAVSVPFRGISFLNDSDYFRHAVQYQFPSPSGVSHFSIGTGQDRSRSPPQFPSPSGVSHFSICWELDHARYNRVSVPFRGISFLNIFNVQHGLFAVCFRPLPGYLISQSDCTLHCQVCLTFPSPSGVSHFSIVSVKSMPRASRTRFRPLPGYLISQYIIILLNGGQRYVSVPFRGISFLNIPLPCGMILLFVLFPSPSGVSHFSIQEIAEHYFSQRFRPLPGYLISQYE